MEGKGGAVTVVIVIFLCSVIAVVSISMPTKRKERMLPDEQKRTLDRVRNNFAKLDPKYARIPLYSDTSSYTEDKKRISLCIVDPQTKRVYDDNTVMYVALHELSHVIDKNYDDKHTGKFRQIFAGLLKRAEQLGFYDPRIPMPEVYCGVS